MIISCVSDEALDEAIRSLAHPDEDVFTTVPGRPNPLRRGFPRVVVYESDRPAFEGVRLGPGPEGEPPSVIVTAGTLARWRFEHRMDGSTGDLSVQIGERLRGVVASASGIPWIDRVFRGLERASGSRLPRAFRGLARRFLEFPAYYSSLGTVAQRAGLTPGALQGRFLRRGLRSPSEHLRWLRLMAVAEGLGDASLTLGAAADRYGYTSAGNLCRSVQNLAGKVTSELRDEITRLELQTRFARDYLGEEASAFWGELEDLFWGMAPQDDVEGLSA